MRLAQDKKKSKITIITLVMQADLKKKKRKNVQQIKYQIVNLNLPGVISHMISCITKRNIFGVLFFWSNL